MLHLAVNVRVVPVEPGRLVGRKGDVVLKGLAGIDGRLDHLIRVTGRRGVGAVIVEVERGWAHARGAAVRRGHRSEEHTSELQSQSNLGCRLLLEKKKKLEM